ncbi:hypothetical protein GBAR_LOCUS7783 [Geodia barretti]|uniref:Uncharacterized protein n=1 Tax=Geodia barretti TaxID=519541 RepID=A0AA35RIG7_GEOBA|nr:hypothetical protein GBAR_LOCUS7783 [Geodia barretti]CAI8012134.1 hypothetical protein GBAR_LOCUS7783 [Geodia barretti]
MEDGGWSKEDVSFVTLAKAGGRKDLLQHIEYSRPDGQEPVSYPVVDWFAHASPSHSCSPPPPTLPPSLLDWPSSLVEEVPEKKRRRKRDQALRPHKKSSEKTPIKLPKAEPAVNMMQLLAMDYQKEWLKKENRRHLRNRD